jgi:hypothetical protein
LYKMCARCSPRVALRSQLSPDAVDMLEEQVCIVASDERMYDCMAKLNLPPLTLNMTSRLAQSQIEPIDPKTLCGNGDSQSKSCDFAFTMFASEPGLTYQGEVCIISRYANCSVY